MVQKTASTTITYKAPKLGGMSEHLIRQRRNLIITSLIVIFILYTNVEISKISIFGIEVETPKQQSLMNSLWAIWAYFCVRFYQYLRIEPATGFWGICKYKAKTNIAIMVGKKINNETEYGPKIERGIILQNMERKSFLKWEYVIKDYSPKIDVDEEIVRVEIGSCRFVVPIIHGVLYTIINTAKFSDNVFPVLLAFLTAIYGIYKSSYMAKIITILH